ncbi:Rieske 2Fe-2S domain-containing protein [Deinococcus pimensis]|uniref:Rieske 2Fe-2S domain-containing protein n=1 Tax=Deinococcus pimensis TaxID=309888 RepID=UPI0004844C96|nr:Rieske 2Fe-2S domain-containing protein [Deinococcus pimensis]
MKVTLARIADIHEDRALEVDFFGRSILLVKAGDRINAFANTCTHAAGPLLFEDGRFRCEWHGATFNARSGQREDGPGPYPLIRLPTRVEGDDLVYVYGE